MQVKMKNEPIVVVVDITLGDQEKAMLLLESLLIIPEGCSCKYLIQLGQRRLLPELQEQLVRFLGEKNAIIAFALPKIEFPQEFIDQETAKSYTPHRIPLSIKKNWFARNLVLLKSILELEEFVYLSPEAVILQYEWLAKLQALSQDQSMPVQGQRRKLRFKDEIISCGWSADGWFSGQALRRLPLIHTFQYRQANPWYRMSPPGYSWQPSFCLSQEWLSAFDMPLGYVIFALYFKEITGQGNPLVWDSHCREQIDFVRLNRPDEAAEQHQEVVVDKNLLIMNEVGPPFAARKRLRDWYIKQTCKLSEESGQANLKGTSLSLSGPKYNLIGRNERKLTLEDLHNMFSGERCFIIGNGPSLNNTELHKLKNEYTIGLNRIYLNFEKMGFQTTFLCVANPNVLKQFGKDIDQINSVKFLRYHHEYIRNRWNVFFMEHTGFHEFIKDLRGFKWCEGCTVTYCAMQVAYFLGFKTIILVGVDHNFPDKGTPHQLVSAKPVDTNHFHPDYFAKGVKWQYPDLAGSEVSYRVANSEFSRAGRVILDATVDGSLDVFPKCDFDMLFGNEGYISNVR
ncbi:Protein of unknown function DUF115 [Desulfofustis glycolicus DSM 9705]|uniref:6-hydroxymethylpterin diphosphokinase MptE-like domain-containing protein n=2 Tax=Desulfofustis glycolicus TaxID=51195 RepID=A0A1M5YUU7_9BACT|nr:Protein of unknown function DUF115 [Desulfofustis glycolicus DSM 9705]